MKFSEFSDEKLLNCFNKDTSKLLSILYARYRNYGYAIIYSKLSKVNLLNNLYEEKDSLLFESLYESIKTYRSDKGLFRPFFASVLSNITRTRIREFKKDPLAECLSMDQEMNNTDIVFADSAAFASTLPLPNERIDITDKQNKIVNFYNGLSRKKQMKIVRLRAVGYTYKEIANATNCNIKAIRKFLFNMKKEIN